MEINGNIGDKYKSIIEDIETSALIVRDLKSIKSKYDQNTRKNYRFKCILEIMDDCIKLVEKSIVGKSIP